MSIILIKLDQCHAKAIMSAPTVLSMLTIMIMILVLSMVHTSAMVTPIHAILIWHVCLHPGCSPISTDCHTISPSSIGSNQVMWWAGLVPQHCVPFVIAWQTLPWHMYVSSTGHEASWTLHFRAWSLCASWQVMQQSGVHACVHNKLSGPGSQIRLRETSGPKDSMFCFLPGKQWLLWINVYSYPAKKTLGLWSFDISVNESLSSTTLVDLLLGTIVPP